MKTRNSIIVKFSCAIAFALLTVAADAGSPVTVGTKGNEPIVAIAPDGTLYISGLQHLYRSTDGGATWVELAGPVFAQSLTLASDSSISVDPGNRLYFTFDYPYAGNTAVCTSDDHGDTWTCDPAVVPGGTDRMWIVTPTIDKAFEVTNQGLYETAFLTSIDRGATWVPRSLGSGLLEPQTGPLLQPRCSSEVLQVLKLYGNSDADAQIQFYAYSPFTTGAVISDVRPTGLKLPNALPSAAFSRDDVLYTVTEEPNDVAGRQVIAAYSRDNAHTWTRLPPIPQTTAGTATFTWLAAGAPGHIGVIYYYTPDNGAPGALNSTWSVVWAETFNANALVPTWTTTTLEDPVHIGAICAAADCLGANRFAGDFINAIIDSTDTAHLTWMKRENGNGAVSIRYQKIQSRPASTFVPLSCGLIPRVVSRKTHGSAGTFDVDLPLTGTPGIECRSGGANGDYTVVFGFPNNLTSVGGASVTGHNPASGTGTVSSSTIDGSDAHNYIVNLTNVSNAQYLTVTLTNVVDSVGNIGNVVSLQMGVLLGDVNATGLVDGNDVSAVQGATRQPVASDTFTFREDVNCTGLIDGNDVSITQGQTRTSLSANLPITNKRKASRAGNAKPLNR